jgi:predicted kinase
MLIVFGGLPGTGKTTIARELARQLGAVHLRIDSVEQAIRDSRVVSQPLSDAGYRVGYAVAAIPRLVFTGDHLLATQSQSPDIGSRFDTTLRAFADLPF